MKSDENPGLVRPFGFRAPRVPANFGFFLEVTTTGQRYEAICTDISEEGLAAEIAESIAAETEVTMRMLLPGSTTILQIRGIVEYTQAGRCGLNFLDLSTEDQAQIQQFVQSIS
jgi:c-di-GMP-binding flagellar brake protein YcgR